MKVPPPTAASYLLLFSNTTTEVEVHIEIRKFAAYIIWECTRPPNPANEDILKCLNDLTELVDAKFQGQDWKVNFNGWESDLAW